MENKILECSLWIYDMNHVNNIIINKSREIFSSAYPDYGFGRGVKQGDYVYHQQTYFYVVDSKWDGSAEWYDLKLIYMGQINEDDFDKLKFEDLEEFRISLCL